MPKLSGCEVPSVGGALLLFLADTEPQIQRYFMGEKSVGRMYVESSFSTSLSACSDLITS